MPLEIDKAERIIRAFTTEGIAIDEPIGEEGRQGRRRVFRKIAPNVLAGAQGIAVFTAMRFVYSYRCNQRLNQELDPVLCLSQVAVEAVSLSLDFQMVVGENFHSDY